MKFKDTSQLTILSKLNDRGFMGCENSLCGSRGDGGCSRGIVFLRGVIRKWRANWQLLYAHQ